MIDILGGFHLTILLWMFVYKFLGEGMFIFLLCMILLNQLVTLFHILRNCQSIFQSGCTILQFQQQSSELSSFSHPHQPLLLSLFLSFIYLYLKFFGYVSWYVWSWLPNKGLNPCPLQWKWAGGGRGGPNHWTPREVSYCKSYNLFDYSHPRRWKVLFCGFDLHFPNDQWCWASY